MTGWVPIVSDVVDSSLWEEEDYVIKVFFSMLAKKDANFFVRGDIYTVAKYSNKRDRIKEVVKALKILESPDTKKPLVKQEFEGRRIEKCDGGWKILNGAKYQQMVREFSEKKRKREWAAKNRQKKSGADPAYLNNKQLSPSEMDEIQQRTQQIEGE